MLPLCILELGPDDQEMMTALFDKHVELMHKIALYITKNEQDAQEAMSDCFISWCKPHEIEKLHNFRNKPVCELERYVAKCIRNKSIDVVKKRGRERKRFFPFDDELIHSRQLSNEVEDHFILRNEVQDCIDSILSLPEKSREIMLMHYIQELTPKEIGVVFGQSEGTVRSSVSQAKKRLLKKIHKQNGMSDHA